MRISSVVVIGIAALTWSVPAKAWEHVLNDYGNGQVLNAVTAFDEMGDTSLIFGCVMGSGTFHIQFITSGPGVAPTPSEVKVTANGTSFPLAVSLGENEGFLMATASSESAPTLAVAQAIYSDQVQVEAMIEGQAYYFEGGNYSEAIGAVLDGCG